MTGPFRDGRVHVCERMCDTCVFRPGNLMHLRPGTLREMVDGALADESGITCHDTIYTDAPAVCRGFFDRHRTRPLALAEEIGILTFQ